MLAFLKKHYEKLILGVLLAVFILLLALQILLVRETGRIEVKEGENVTYSDQAVYTKENQKKERERFNSYKTLSNFEKWISRPEWAVRDAGKKVEEARKKLKEKEDKGAAENLRKAQAELSRLQEKYKNAEKRFVDFVLPYPITICPRCQKAIPANDFREKKGLAYYCSLTHHRLTPPMEIVQEDRQLDTDKDGLPDNYEKQNKRFNINDKGDAKLDFDNDFYSNIEEYYCDTDPLNAKPLVMDSKGKDASRFVGRLPYFNLLRVADVKRKEYSFRLNNIRVPNNDTSKAQFWVVVKTKLRIAGKLKDVERGKYYKVGDSFISLIDRMKIVGIESGKPDPRTKRRIYRMRVQDEINGDIFTVGAREKVSSQTVEVTLAFRSGAARNEFSVKEGREFKLGDYRTGEEVYTIVKANESDKSILIRAEGGKKDIRVSREMLIDGIVRAGKARKEKADTPKQISRERKN